MKKSIEALRSHLVSSSHKLQQFDRGQVVMLKKPFSLGTLGAIAIGLAFPIALSAAPTSRLRNSGNNPAIAR